MTGASRRAPRWVGRWLMTVGAWHMLFGLWWFATPLRLVAREGMWNSVGWSADQRALAFWFLAAGAFGLLAGSLADDAEARGQLLPRSFGGGLTVLALIGGVALPRSAFWLLLVPGLAALHAHHTATRSPRVEPRS